MKAHVSHYATGLAALLCLLTPRDAAATNYAVFVDGAYHSTSGTTELDTLIDERIVEGKAIFDARHPEGESHRVDTEDDFETTLGGLECGENDTLTIYMMGHANKDRFRFVKNGRDDLTAKELVAAISNATSGCQCKVHVVIFSCHSGSFLYDLFKDPHVESVYLSCGEKEKSTSFQTWEGTNRIDGGDWAGNYNEDWTNAPAGTNIADELQLASLTAESNLPTGGTETQEPQGWRTGLQEALAHVEDDRYISGNAVKLRFYNPEFLRNFTMVFNLEPDVVVRADLSPCNWVRLEAVFGRPQASSNKKIKYPIRITNAIDQATAPTESILGHVKSRDPLKVEIQEPTWMYGKIYTLQVDGAEIGAEVNYCTWIRQAVTITDPENKRMRTSQDVHRTNMIVRALIQCGSVNEEARTFKSHVQYPPFLHCRTQTVQYPVSETGRVDDVSNGELLWVDFDLYEDASGFHPVSNIVRCSKADYYEFYIYDAGMSEIVAPKYEFPDPHEAISNATAGLIVPEVILSNTGMDTFYADPSMQLTCAVTLDETVVYQDTQPVPELGLNSNVTVRFEAWMPPQPGRYTTRFRLYAYDDNPYNNEITIRTDVYAMPPVISAFELGFSDEAQIFYRTIQPTDTVHTVEVTGSLTGLWQRVPILSRIPGLLGYDTKIERDPLGLTMFVKINCLELEEFLGSATAPPEAAPAGTVPEDKMKPEPRERQRKPR